MTISLFDQFCLDFANDPAFSTITAQQEANLIEGQWFQKHGNNYPNQAGKDAGFYHWWNGTNAYARAKTSNYQNNPFPVFIKILKTQI